MPLWWGSGMVCCSGGARGQRAMAAGLGDGMPWQQGSSPRACCSWEVASLRWVSHSPFIQYSFYNIKIERQEWIRGWEEKGNNSFFPYGVKMGNIRWQPPCSNHLGDPGGGRCSSGVWLPGCQLRRDGTAECAGKGTVSDTEGIPSAAAPRKRRTAESSRVGIPSSQ